MKTVGRADRAAWLVLQLFLRSSRVQRKRAVLTIAAIAWGIAVAACCCWPSARASSARSRAPSRAWASNIAVMWPGETTKSWQGLAAGPPIRPRVDDIALVRERVTGSRRRRAARCAAGARASPTAKRTVNARVTGTSPDLRRAAQPHRARRAAASSITHDEQRAAPRDLPRRRAGARPVRRRGPGRTHAARQQRAVHRRRRVLEKKMQMGTYGGPGREPGA